MYTSSKSPKKSLSEKYMYQAGPFFHGTKIKNNIAAAEVTFEITIH